jgi:hypothetical protein
MDWLMDFFGVVALEYPGSRMMIMIRTIDQLSCNNIIRTVDPAVLLVDLLITAVQWSPVPSVIRPQLPIGAKVD